MKDKIDDLYEDWDDNVKNFMREIEEQKLDEKYFYDLYSYVIAGIGLIAMIPYVSYSFWGGILISFLIYWFYYFVSRFLLLVLFYGFLREIHKWMAKLIIIVLPFLIFLIRYCIVKL